jgi:hypothetical protein
MRYQLHDYQQQAINEVTAKINEGITATSGQRTHGGKSSRLTSFHRGPGGGMHPLYRMTNSNAGSSITRSGNTMPGRSNVVHDRR